MRKYFAYPYVIWCGLFIICPLLIVVIFSLLEQTSTGKITFSLVNYQRFFNILYLKVFFRSLSLATIATILCLIFGYPMAMILANMKESKRRFAVLLFVMPMWMNFLLRTYAWVAILSRNGLVNSILKWFNLESVDFLFKNGTVLLGMVYNFIPFMILPIYTVLSKVNKNTIEAAEDLGANKITVFMKIIMPLSIPGVISGITMVFMPAVSTFVISALLGGGQQVLIGNLVEQQFMSVGDWYFGSAISIVMMIVILLTMAIMSKYDSDESENTLW